MRILPAAIFAAALSAPALAQEFKRTVLQRVDVPLGVPHESVFGMGEVPPGVSAGRHTHPGVEMLVVVDGEVDFMIEGEAPKHLKSGDSMLVPVGKAHDVRGAGSSTAKIISTWMVEKGKPMATPAPVGAK